MRKALTFVKAFAVWTGLEPATPCVTGRYSNQLNYQTFILKCSSLYFFELTGKLEYLRSTLHKPLFVVLSLSSDSSLASAFSRPVIHHNQLNYQTFIFRQFSAMAKVTRFFIKYNDLYNNLFTSIL